MCTRRTTVLILVFLLIGTVWAKPVPLGTVSSCQAATIRGAHLVPGSTVFSGDTIDVGTEGSVWIAVRGGGQVQVFGNSTVRLTSAADSIQLAVDRGRAQTNSKIVVINNVPTTSGPLPSSTEAIRNGSKNKDCEISKNTRSSRPCHDDTD